MPKLSELTSHDERTTSATSGGVGGRKLMPECDVEAQVTDADYAPTKSGSGVLCKVILEVLHPEEYAGKRIYHNFNVQNPSKMAVKIGHAQLKALALATTGVSELPDDPTVLLFKPFSLGVGIEEASQDYPAKNRAIEFKALTRPSIPTKKGPSQTPLFDGDEGQEDDLPIPF